MTARESFGLRVGTLRCGEKGRALSLSLYCTHGRRESDRDIWPTFIVPFAAALMTLPSTQPFLWQRTDYMLGGTACDLATACDCVNRDNLLAKLHCHGIRVVAEDCFRSWLTNRRQNIGKVIQKPTRCINNSFTDLQDQLNMFRANFCPSSGAQD